MKGENSINPEGKKARRRGTYLMSDNRIKMKKDMRWKRSGKLGGRAHSLNCSPAKPIKSG